jgi:Ca2+-transporting ATPase
MPSNSHNQATPQDETHWHHLGHGDVARLLQTNPEAGLSNEEAAKRLARYGPNSVSPRRGQPAWLRFLLQFHQPLVYILLVACVVTSFLGEWVDCGVIFGIVLVNAIVGFIQESKAGKAIDALNRMMVTETTVRRGGKKHRIPSAELVPGDVMVLQSGDRVPADLRLFEVRNLHCDESALTGESLPVPKHAEPVEADVVLADRRNLAYAGTLVSSGQAEGLVWATGDRTETGRIAWLISEAVEISTPLTRKIAEFSRLLLWIILGLAGLAFLIGLWRGTPVVDTFMAAVALAVGAIPEGLPAAVTIVLAIGVSRMAQRRAIIRKLPAVETLGSTTVICSDKTGTLTENQMTVQRVFSGGAWFDITGGGYEPTGEVHHKGKPIDLSAHPALAQCFVAGVLCNESELISDDNGRAGIQGDPTEAALLVAGAKAGVSHQETRGNRPRIDMIPFESEHMFRATLHETSEGTLIYKVGAVERLLERCADELAPDGTTRPLNPDAVRAAVDEMAAHGLRVLAFARRDGGHVEGPLGHAHVENGLTFLGLQGMIDPPRNEAIQAVAHCQAAGIRVKMITGDHAVTAQVIATRIGLGGNEEVTVINGQELEKIPDEDLPGIADSTVVFARVAPEQKLRLVRALQSRGHVVAMTGDGVNDAPALKQADIGVAMGITGTDVAKGAADMILTDDNFASIAAAVEEGRGVFENLRKFIIWTLPTNVGEGGIILVVLPAQLLWVNMTTALFLGLTLVFEPKPNDLMSHPPRPPQRPLMTFPLFMRTGLVSLFMVGGGIWLFIHEMKAHGETVAEARTAVVNVLVLVEAAYLFNCRSLTRHTWSLGFFTNPLLLTGVACMILIQLAFTYSPLMNHLFNSAPISLGSWGRITAVAMVVFLSTEFEKWIRFRGGRGAHCLPD